MVKDFYNYWSEADTKTGKLLWEKRETFEVGRRMGTWKKKDREIHGSKRPQPKKITDANIDDIH